MRVTFVDSEVDGGLDADSWFVVAVVEEEGGWVFRVEATVGKVGGDWTGASLLGSCVVLVVEAWRAASQANLLSLSLAWVAGLFCLRG